MDTHMPASAAVARMGNLRTQLSDLELKQQANEARLSSLLNQEARTPSKTGREAGGAEPTDASEFEERKKLYHKILLAQRENTGKEGGSPFQLSQKSDGGTPGGSSQGGSDIAEARQKLQSLKSEISDLKLDSYRSEKMGYGASRDDEQVGNVSVKPLIYHAAGRVSEVDNFKEQDGLKITRLETRMAETEAVVVKAKQENDRLSHMLQEAEDALKRTLGLLEEQHRDSADERERTFVQYSEELASVTAEKDVLSQKVTTLTRDRDSLKAEVGRLLSVLQDRSSSPDVQKTQAEKLAQQYSAEISSLNEERDRLRTHLDAAVTELQRLRLSEKNGRSEPSPSAVGHVANASALTSRVNDRQKTQSLDLVREIAQPRGSFPPPPERDLANGARKLQLGTGSGAVYTPPPAQQQTSQQGNESLRVSVLDQTAPRTPKDGSASPNMRTREMRDKWRLTEEKEQNERLDRMTEGCVMRKVHFGNPPMLVPKKFSVQGKMANRLITLSEDHKNLSWVDPKKPEFQKREANISDIVSIAHGRQSEAFLKRALSNTDEWMSFTIYFADRTLDLIANDKETFLTWFLGLQTLICAKRSERLSKGRLLWRLGMFRLEQAAEEFGQSRAQLLTRWLGFNDERLTVADRARFMDMCKRVEGDVGSHSGVAFASEGSIPTPLSMRKLEPVKVTPTRPKKRLVETPSKKNVKE